MREENEREVREGESYRWKGEEEGRRREEETRGDEGRGGKEADMMERVEEEGRRGGMVEERRGREV